MLDTLDRWLSSNVRPLWLRNLWNRLWVRQDEFHPSLNMDVDLMLKMDEEQRNRYINDLARRRKIAHERDLGK